MKIQDNYTYIPKAMNTRLTGIHSHSRFDPPVNVYSLKHDFSDIYPLHLLISRHDVGYSD